MEVCSPSAKKNFETDHSCFDKEALIRIAKILNIRGLAKKSKHTIWNEINNIMTSQCNGSGREWCWVDKLGPAAKSDPKINKSLKPAKPGKWYKNPSTWLTNYDIIAVMRQYDADESNKYKFLGVFPIDFTVKDAAGQCMYSEICGIDITKFDKKGIKYVGFITNLDKHDEPGSHWTSTFVCIDPNSKSYGAYYYDSVSRTPPPEVKNFMENVKRQLQIKYPGAADFKIQYNVYQEQKGNNECGMFSMLFQLRWLKALRNNSAATFEDVLKVKMTDADMQKYRDVLFRPNTNEVLKKELALKNTK